MQDIINKINKLKKEKKAVILAHCYQNVEIDLVADFVGDSLQLSRLAAETDAETVIFAGVYFMAETAKILSPNKKVLLPRLDAGCKMADMIDLRKIKDFKAKYPDVPVVCYVNSSAEVKSEADICCTSANAVNVVKSLNVPKVLFVPDRNLGSYVQKQLKNVEVITYSGCCPIHENIEVNDVLKMKEKYPDAKVLIHPECREEVVTMADYVGSTTGIIKCVRESNEKEFIIVTEKGVVDRLQRDYPEKNFVLISDNAVCADMKKITLNDILNVLEKENNEIFIDENISVLAKKSIEKMIAVNG